MTVFEAGFLAGLDDTICVYIDIDMRATTWPIRLQRPSKTAASKDGTWIQEILHAQHSDQLATSGVHGPCFSSRDHVSFHTPSRIS